MTAFEIYALFGSPLLLLVWALAMFWWTGMLDARDSVDQSPAE